MKKCFKCEINKPLDDFYKHERMADGHLNKCKECTKLDTFGRTEEQIANRKYRDRNRPNHNERIARNKERPVTEADKESKRRWSRKNRHKRNAHNKVKRAIERGVLERPISCNSCGSSGKIEAHHEDYSKPLEVEWLCVPCHNNAHKIDLTTR